MPEGKRIARVTKGDKNRTMMHTAVANEVIDAINDQGATVKALRKMSISPNAAGSVKWSDANVVLDLKGVGGTPGVITGAVNGVPSTATIPFIVDWAEI